MTYEQEQVILCLNSSIEYDVDMKETDKHRKQKRIEINKIIEYLKSRYQYDNVTYTPSDHTAIMQEIYLTLIGQRSRLEDKNDICIRYKLKELSDRLELVIEEFEIALELIGYAIPGLNAHIIQLTDPDED